MCFITSNFIFNAKLMMDYLNFKPESIDELTISNLNYHTSEVLLSLEEDSEAFIVFYYYHWLAKRLKKLTKAFTSEKWNSTDVSFQAEDEKTDKYIYDNVIIVTNIFSRKMNSIYYDNSTIVIEDIKKDKSKNNLFDTVKVDNYIYVFEKQYLKSLKKKKYADIDKAVAVINTVRVNKNGDKYVSFICFDEENLKNLDCCTFAVKDIKRLISYSSFISLISIQMCMNSMRMCNYRHF